MAGEKITAKRTSSAKKPRTSQMEKSRDREDTPPVVSGGRSRENSTTSNGGGGGGGGSSSGAGGSITAGNKLPRKKTKPKKK